MRARSKKTKSVRGAVLGVALALTVGASRASAAPPVVTIPERTRVCMMQDTIMAVPAIPLAQGGKTYYGCCEMCKAKIAAEPARYTLARDPVSGASVDKATAVLLSVDGRVLYFESEKTRGEFAGRLSTAR